MITLCAEIVLSGQTKTLDMHQLCNTRHESHQQSMSTQINTSHDSMKRRKQTTADMLRTIAAGWEASVTAIVVALARIQPASSTMVARTYTMVA